MDTERVSKRRKLYSDTPAPKTRNSTPGSRAPAKKDSPYSSKKPGFQLRREPSELVKSDPPKHKLSAHEAWAEAKAKRLESRRGSKQTGKDVYDDIEGAHPSPQKKAASTVKDAGTLGFFKQFHAPKVDSARGSPTPQARKAPARKVPAQDEKEAQNVSDAEGGAEIDEDGDESGDENAGEPAKKWTGTAKGWASVDKKPKTFEDEIRELEEAAQKEADQEEQGEDGEGAAKRRSTGRRRAAAVEASKAAFQQSRQPAKSREQAIHRAEDDQGQLKQVRKQRIASPEPAAPEDDEQDEEDAMDIDEPDNGRIIPRQRSPPPAAHLFKKAITPSKPKPQQASKSKSIIPQHSFEADELRYMQTQVLEKLTGKRPIPLTKLQDEYTKVSQLITQTVTAGESNSMLVIGARGSGKTALVNQILREQAVSNPDDFHIVRLNGFIHTDDKIAAREIWRQLGREMELDETESTARNYADTLTTLLALLSHPAEQGQDQAADQITKSVIFILDEFELFANHPRQTLLYNLFDIAQSRKAPIAVLGLTTRIDVSEALEKRVKSRFSHRYVHPGLAKSFAAYQEACKAVLSAQAVDGVLEEQLCEDWNAVVEVLLATEPFMNHLRRLYYTTKSVPDFMTSMLMPIATLSIEEEVESITLADHLMRSLKQSSLAPPDSKLTLLSTLSTLQLALLICAARLTNIYNTDIVSFLLAYEEYKVLASKARLQATGSGSAAHGVGARISGKDVAKDAWEALIECGLILQDGRGGGGRVDVGLEEIGMSGVDLGGWGRWCKEI